MKLKEFGPLGVMHPLRPLRSATAHVRKGERCVTSIILEFYMLSNRGYYYLSTNARQFWMFMSLVEYNTVK